MIQKNDARAAKMAPAARSSSFRKSLVLCAVSLAVATTAVPATAGTWWHAHPDISIGSRTINVRNKGARGNGSHNDTSAIQAAIDALPSSGGTVYVPDGKYMINPVKSLRLRSHVRLKLSSGARLVAIPTSHAWSYVVRAWRVNNVEIVGGRIVGERKHHRGSSGEWGMGVSVLGSNKVFVHNIRLANCWGDGIYIGDIRSGDRRVRSSNVTLNHVVSTENRRQGLSITPSTRVYVVNSTFSNTHGTLPQAGIDIEPQGRTEQVRIENSVLAGNRGNGLELHDHVKDLVVHDNTIKYNHGFGIYAGSPGYMHIGANVIARNALAGVSLNHHTHHVHMHHNQITRNSTRYVPASSSWSSRGRDLKVASTTSYIDISNNTWSH